MSTLRVAQNLCLLYRRTPEVVKCGSLFNKCGCSRSLTTSQGKAAKHFIGRLSLISIGIVGTVAYASYDFRRRSQQRRVQEGTKAPVKEDLVKPPINGLPQSIKYLIIGGGTSAFSAFRSIRANDPRAKVIVISDEDYEPYMKPPLSKELWFSENELVKNFKFRQWNGRERTVFYEHPEFYMGLEKLLETDTGGVSLIKGYKVVNLNSVQRKATLDNGQTINYEKCLIATGGSPKLTPIFESAPADIKDKVLLYHNLDDFKKLRNICETDSIITIVGGGFLGSELACALGRRSQIIQKPLRVYSIYPDSGNLSNILPEYLSRWTTDMIRREGTQIIPNVDIKSVKKLGDKIGLELTNGETIETDYVLLTVGLAPNVELAESAQLEVDKELGGFRVNSELQARSNIWVSGDVSCFYDVKLGRRRIEHHDNAILSGRLAGENMATGKGKHFWLQSMFWSDLGPDLGFEGVGLIDSSLPTVGVFSKPSPLPESKPPHDQQEKPTSESSASNQDQPKLRPPSQNDLYDRGVIFYLKDKVVVGVLLWNLFDRMAIARRIINEAKEYDDMSELAKLFYIKPTYSDETPEDKSPEDQAPE